MNHRHLKPRNGKLLYSLWIQCVFLVLTVWSVKVEAACLDDHVVQRIVKGYPVTPIVEPLPIKTLADAYCSQQKIVNTLSHRLDLEFGKGAGDSVGYKVGFTSLGGQKKFAVQKPAIGVLLKHMLVPNAQSLSAQFGYRPLIEPDLLVVVADTNIMNATTLLEVAAGLETIHAFIELPAIQIAPEQPASGLQLIAINIAATKMVLGEGIAVVATPAFIEKVGEATSLFFNADNELIQQAPLSALMEHPFNSLLWLIKELRAQGKTLNKGDYVSLGAVGRLFPVANSAQEYRYEILGLSDSPLRAKVSFTAN